MIGNIPEFCLSTAESPVFVSFSQSFLGDESGNFISRWLGKTLLTFKTKKEAK